MGWRHASCCPRRSPSPLPCADARRGHEPSGTRRAAVCPHFPPGSTPRAVTAPLSPRVAHVSLRTPVTVCPPAPRLRSSRLPLADSLCRRSPPSPLLPDGLPSSVPPPPLPGSRPAHLLPCGIAASVSDSLCPALYPSLSDGLAPLEPRSVRADVIPGSERHAPTGARQRGGGARRVDRGRGARPPPVGRAAERARSAARASPGHQPPHSVRAPSPRPLGVVVDHLPL